MARDNSYDDFDDYDDEFDDDYDEDEEYDDDYDEEEEENGYGDDIGDGYGEDLEEEDQEEEEQDDKGQEDSKKDKKGKGEEKQDVKFSGIRRNSKKILEKQAAKNAKMYGSSIPIVNICIGRCPFCKCKSIYASARLTDVIGFGVMPNLVGLPSYITYYCFNSKCKRSYFNNWCCNLQAANRWSEKEHRHAIRKQIFRIL